jgi:hypothetical protein
MLLPPPVISSLLVVSHAPHTLPPPPTILHSESFSFSEIVQFFDEVVEGLDRQVYTSQGHCKRLCSNREGQGSRGVGGGHPLPPPLITRLLPRRSHTSARVDDAMSALQITRNPKSHELKQAGRVQCSDAQLFIHFTAKCLARREGTSTAGRLRARCSLAQAQRTQRLKSVVLAVGPNN